MWSRRCALATALGSTAAVAFAGQASAASSDESTPDIAGLGRQTASGRIYEIRAGRQRALIAGVAATLLSWQVDGTEQLLTHQPDDVGEGYQGKTILPWPNRIDHGQYHFDGRDLQVPINEPKRQAALHGLMSFVEWRAVEHLPDRVVLHYFLHPQYGYPFSLAFRVEYQIDAQGLRRTLQARNAGTTSAPFGTASHTYIAASTGTIDSIVLELPASTYYLTNDRLIPTGTAPVDGSPYDFRTPRRLAGTKMDTAFTRLTRQPDGTAVVRFQRPSANDVELWMDSTYEYLQVYTDDTPDTPRPGRAGITVEPVTCAPNAFVTGDGLIVLRPGDTYEGTWGLRVPE